MRRMVRVITVVVVAVLMAFVGSVARADVEIRTSNTTENVQVTTGEAHVGNDSTSSSQQTNTADAVGAQTVTTPGNPSPGSQVAVVEPAGQSSASTAEDADAAGAEDHVASVENGDVLSGNTAVSTTVRI